MRHFTETDVAKFCETARETDQTTVIINGSHYYLWVRLPEEIVTVPSGTVIDQSGCIHIPVGYGRKKMGEDTGYIAHTDIYRVWS